MYAPGREAGGSHVKHTVILYLYVVYHLWFTPYYLPVAGLHDEYAQASSQAEPGVGLLSSRSKNLLTLQVEIDQDQPWEYGSF